MNSELSGQGAESCISQSAISDQQSVVANLRSRSCSWWLTRAVLVIPMVFFLISIVLWGLNIPYQDDIDAIFGFLGDWHGAGWGERLGLLFAPHNEHRIVVSRLVVLGWHELFGAIWLPGLMLLGGVALVMLFYLLYRFVPIKEKLYYLFPLSWFFFVPHYAEASYWAMVSLSTFGVLLAAGLTLWCLQKHGRVFFFGALLLAIVTVFSNGNGLFVWPAGILILVVQRRWSALAGWGGVMLFSVGLYFFHYQTLPINLWESIGTRILYFITFLGSAFAFGFRSLGLALPAGLVALGATGWLLSKKYYRQNPWQVALLVFLLLTAASTALSRSGYGIEQAVSSRYRIYSILVFTILFLSFFDLYYSWFRQRWVVGLVATLMISYGTVSYLFGLPPVQTLRNTIISEAAAVPPRYLYPDQQRAQGVMTEAKGRGWW